MKLNLQKLAVFLVTFTLAVGLLSQTSAPQASAELRLPDCIEIIANCNNQDCSAEASNEVNDNNSISQSTQADYTLSNQVDISQISQDNVNSTTTNTVSLADTLENTVLSELTNTASLSDDDQNTQTSTASTTCNYNNED